VKDHPAMRFKRPIYGVLTFYGMTLVCFLVIAQAFFAQRTEGRDVATTKAAFWVLAIIMVLAVLKLVRDLLNPKTRKFLLSRSDELKTDRNHVDDQ